MVHNQGVRIKREQETLKCMIRLYCRQVHSTPSLCEACSELETYALRRLTLCRYGEEKTTCEMCPRHCYRSDYKDRIKIVMRYAGPRMLLHHPIRAIQHLINNYQSGSHTIKLKK